MQLVMPNRPGFALVSTPGLPASFCSAQARNQFHDTVFKPALAQADQNNSSAIAYMQVLQQLFDAAGQKNDQAKMGPFSSEAQSFRPVASQVHDNRLSFDKLFTQMMALPMGGKC